jgi:hypothetical protein
MRLPKLSSFIALPADITYKTQRTLHTFNDVANPFTKAHPLFDVPKDVLHRDPVHLPGPKGVETITLQSITPKKAGRDHRFGINESLGVQAIKKMQTNLQTGISALALTSISTGISLLNMYPNVHVPSAVDLAQKAVGVLSMGVLGKSIRKLRGYTHEFKTPNTYGLHLNNIKTETGHINGLGYQKTIHTPTTFLRIEEHPVIAEDFYRAISKQSSGQVLENEKRAVWGNALRYPEASFHLFSENSIPPSLPE